MKKDIFEYIKTEENNYKATPVPVIDGYDWSMYEHIRLSILYKNSQLSSGKDDNKPVKNIMLPILRLQYRAEGFDVKDIEIFVDNAKDYYKSFLVKKFHEKWTRENNIDTFIDEMVESYVDFGGALVKDVNDVRPEVVPLQRLAFCDQTDILSGTIAEKHNYAPDQLKEMEAQGWGSETNGATATIDEVIILSDNQKTTQVQGQKAQVPNKYIEVYEVHGMFPSWWLKDTEEGEDKDYVRQLHIVCFYTDQNGDKQGITLFKGKEQELPYKLVLRDKIYGRALGLGGAEELFEPQVWTTYDAIRMKGMLDAASKIIYQTADKSFENRNRTDNLDNGEILTYEDGKPLAQLNTTPVNAPLFERSLNDWKMHARELGGATEALLGETPPSGTPFKLVEQIIMQGQGIHEYRKGKLATFLGEIYRDWILPYISREIVKGQIFLATLDMDELQSVADNLVICETNKQILNKILNGETIFPDEIDQIKQQVRDNFMKGGNQKFIEIFKGEMKNIPIDVEVNIAGKQKGLSAITDKLTNVFRQIIAAPQVLDDPRMVKIFNQILENSGLTPIDFYSKPKPIQPQPQSVASIQPLQNMAGVNNQPNYAAPQR